MPSIMPTTSTTTLDQLDWLRTLAVRLASYDDADDLVQETVLAAVRRPPQVSADRPLRPWLATVVRNRARLESRARRRREQRERESVDPAASSVRPDDELHRVRTLQILSAALDELDELDRRIIVRRFFDDENATQIGAALGIPASTVRSRLRRALAQLRSSLDRRCGGRHAWALALLGPAPRARTGALGLGPKLGLTLSFGVVAGVSWSSCERDSSGEAQPQAVLAPTPAPAPSERERWEQRRTSIRAALAAERDEPVDQEAIERARHDALATARAGFAALERACMEDLGRDVSGAITLSAVVIGDPKIGTIFDSVEVVTETVDDPEIIACLRESMLAFVGAPPAVPIETSTIKSTSVGRHDNDTIFDKIVAAHYGEIAACQRNHGFDGTGVALVEFTIGDDRRTAEAAVMQTDLPEDVVECITTAGLRWAFPADLIGGVFAYEFRLPVGGYERVLGGRPG